MKILFKQFFKTFKKNFFLIVGLSALMMALSFLISASINISASFTSALNNLNSQGNISNVVSNVSDSFGYLDFSYNQILTKEPYNVYTSSLSLQHDKNGRFTREVNTIFPYDKDKLDSRGKRNGVDFGINSGITVNPDATNYLDLFTFDTNNSYASWNYNYGLTVDKPVSLLEDRRKYAQSYSFVDTKKDDKGKITSNEIFFNPKWMLFNKWGIPTSIFTKGELSYSYKLKRTPTNRNNKVIDKIPNIYDSTGLGITTDFFNRCDNKIYSIDDADATIKLLTSDYLIWEQSQDFANEIFSHFLVEKSVNPYSFSFNLNNSSGPISYFLKTNPQYFEKAFNKIFYENTISRENVPGGNKSNIHSNIELIKNNDSYSINLGIDDEIFVDYNEIKIDSSSNIPIEEQIKTERNKQIENNKKIYLNNFAGFLSTKFTSVIKDMFLDDAFKHFSEKGINSIEQSEFYFLDPKTKHEYLFVGKSKNGSDNIVVESGSNLDDDNNINKIMIDISKKVNNQLSTSTFYAISDLLKIIPESNFPKRPEKIPNKISNESKYLWFSLLRYCLSKVVETLDGSVGRDAPLPNSMVSNPYFLILVRLLKDFEVILNGNNIETTFWLTSSYTSLNFANKFNVSIFNNYFCVINSAYAVANDKKHLVTGFDKVKVNTWIEKIALLKEANSNDLNNAFEKWIGTLSSSDLMNLSYDEIKTIFRDEQELFNIWLNNLNDEYKIQYQNNIFLINGFGLSPEYAYPSISPTSPIPVPETQAIIFLNKSTYNNLNVSDVNKFNYYTYSSNKLSDKQIINDVNNYSIDKLNTNIFNASKIEDAKNIGQIWLRIEFPRQINNLIIIFSVIGSVVLILLSIFVVYLLLNSFIKNMLEPIALCMGNGVPLYKIITACMLNLGIVTTFSTMVAYIISYFAQSSIISLFSNIWLVPGTAILPFSPLIFIPLVLITFIVFAGLLSFIIYRKFKKPIPQIIANKEDVKANWTTKILKNNRLKIPGLFKLTIGFSTINIGRLALLSLLGAAALGGIVSSSIINDKFIYSKTRTQETTQYNYDFNFINVNESTGLYKPQKFSEMGLEDKSLGINSIYLDKATFDQTPKDVRYPYYKEQFAIKKIPQGGNEKNLEKITPERYLSNMIYPSFKIYKNIFDHKMNAFFNGTASIFLLDLKVKFANVNLNIWDFIKPNFPTWLVTQLEDQSQTFQNAIMNYYGEWYYKFTDNDNAFQIVDVDNDDNYHIANINKEISSGLYYAETTIKGKKKITKPYYVWVDSDQVYYSEANDIAQRLMPKSGSSISLAFDRANSFGSYNIKGTFKPEPITSQDEVVWKFVPAFNLHHQIDPNKSNSSGDPDNIRFNDKFIDFITTIYADERVSNSDSKISFGIIPFDKNIDETYTVANVSLQKQKENVQLLGIKPDSKFVVLKDNDSNQIGNLLIPSNNHTINAIVNNGAALKYNLKIGDSINVHVNNNSLTNSYAFNNSMLNLNQDEIIDNNYTLKIVGINNDSFGTKFYINQIDANHLTSLDKMPVYNEVVPNVKYAMPQQANSNFVPFNGTFSKNKKLLISHNSIPFYTFANIWTTWTKTNEITNLNYVNNIFDCILTHDPNLLLQIAKKIKNTIDNTFIYDPNNIATTRANILEFINKNYSSSSFMKAMSDLNQKFLLQSSIGSCIPSTITNQMFDMISSLTVTLIIVVVSIIIPLLIIVTLITSLSIVNDLTKNLGLMKILGFSNRNILLLFTLMYSFIFIITTILGLGIMFACTYGLQYLVFNLTSIFITNYVQPGTFFIGVFAAIGIFLLTILFIGYILKKKGIENSIKF